MTEVSADVMERSRKIESTCRVRAGGCSTRFGRA